MGRVASVLVALFLYIKAFLSFYFHLNFCYIKVECESGFARVSLVSHPQLVQNLSGARPLTSGRAVDNVLPRCGRDTTKTRARLERKPRGISKNRLGQDLCYSQPNDCSIRSYILKKKRGTFLVRSGFVIFCRGIRPGLFRLDKDLKADLHVLC